MNNIVTKWNSPKFETNNFNFIYKYSIQYFFYLSKHPIDNDEASIGLNIIIDIIDKKENEASILCTCSIFPKDFLIVDMTFDEYKLCIEAAIGQCSMELKTYLVNNGFINDFNLSSLTDEDLYDMNVLYKKFQLIPLGASLSSENF